MRARPRAQAGRKPHAHSDYIKGPIALWGLEGQVDVMVEAKGKELAVLRYRERAWRQARGLGAGEGGEGEEGEEGGDEDEAAGGG